MTEATEHPAADGEKTPGAHTHAEGLYRLRLSRVTSWGLVLTTQRTFVFTGTVDQLEASYRRVRLHNLLWGWESFPFGIVWPIALWRNRRALRVARLCAQSRLGQLSTVTSVPIGV